MPAPGISSGREGRGGDGDLALRRSELQDEIEALERSRTRSVWGSWLGLAFFAGVALVTRSALWLGAVVFWLLIAVVIQHVHRRSMTRMIDERRAALDALAGGIVRQTRGDGDQEVGT